MGWFDNAKALCVSAAKAAQVPACPPQPWRRRKPFLFIKNGEKPQARQIEQSICIFCVSKKQPNSPTGWFDNAKALCVSAAKEIQIAVKPVFCCRVIQYELLFR